MAVMDVESPEYKLDCCIWLLEEERQRTIRLAQVVASLLVQTQQPQLTQEVMMQLLNGGTVIQGAPPVLP
jgi:hypothetical protein